MLLTSVIRFQKTLALAAAASNSHEAAAAEFAARRIMDTCHIDPTAVPNASLYSRVTFAGNALLQKLRDEWRENHPLPTPQARAERSSESAPDSFAIPFNIDGFRKHTRKRKSKSQGPRVTLTWNDYEKIRKLLNDGLNLAEIAEQTGLPRDTINSTRAWHKRSGKWRQDSRGDFYWTSRSHPPAPTNPQPSAENVAAKESTAVP